jgi:putative ABC transport system permease protein
MQRIALLLIGLATPASDREWVLGDIVEELEHRTRAEGSARARRWLWREAARVVLHAPRFRAVVASTRHRPADARGDGPMSTLWRDVRYGIRLLGRSPGFAAMAIVTLALGIGANTAMFAVVNAVLFKHLPFQDPDRLMLLHLRMPDREAPGTYRDVVWSYPKFQTFMRAQQAFEDAALFSGRDLNLAGDGEPEKIRGEVVTERYPAILGIEPIVGRSFTVEEARQEGSGRVAMIGHGLWSRRFGSDPGILGRTIDINAMPYTVVGVLPRGFRGLNGDAQVWVPLAALEPSQMRPDNQFSHSYYQVARRKPDVPDQAAVAAVQLLGGTIDATHRSGDGRAWGATAASLYDSRVDADVRQASLLMLGAVGVVLLIACVNLTNLVWARAIGRRREVGVRVAIGASRGRIVRQFLVEGGLLATLGACLGLVLAWTLLQAAGALLPESDVFFRTSMAPGSPRTAGAAGLTRIGAAMIGLDAITVIFTGGVAVVTALLVSLIPALQASVLRPVDALRTGGKSMTDSGLHPFSTRTTLVTVQLALALILMAGAGLMIKSASRLYATDIGVNPEGVLTVRVDLPSARYSSETGPAFFTQLLERVRQLPGVESAGLGNCVPVSGGCNATTISFPPRPSSRTGSNPIVGIYWATPDFFETVGIRLLQGRTFTAHDRAGQPKVALVSEAAAREFWPNESPLGKKIAVGQGGFHDGAEVVGVVSNVRYRSIEMTARPDVYIPLSQSHQARMRIFVRSHVDRWTLVAAITRELRTLDPNLPLSEIKSMDEWMGDAMWRTRVGMWVLSAFAALALLLTALGVFGVMAQTVAQRTPEIGIRMALGAQRRDVLALVLGRALLVTAAGLVIGVGCGLALTRLMATLLYGVPPHDPITFTAVAVILTLVALAACYLPARRATRVDAVVALRSE